MTQHIEGVHTCMFIRTRVDVDMYMYMTSESVSVDTALPLPTLSKFDMFYSYDTKQDLGDHLTQGNLIRVWHFVIVICATMASVFPST